VPLLLLDLDNTLADRQAAFDHWATVKLADWAPRDPTARRFLEEGDRDGFRPRREFLADVKQRFRLAESIDELLGEYRRIKATGFPPIADDVKQALTVFRDRGWKLGIVTNGDGEVQRTTVENVGLSALFDAVVISGEVGIRKPDPRIFQLAADACGAPLSGAWMVGDGEPDVYGAAAAQIQSVWLTRGRTWPRTDITPTHIANTLLAALALIDR
jgi:HAD superfamily hydrolase (TIGR01549 family)